MKTYCHWIRAVVLAGLPLLSTHVQAADGAVELRRTLHRTYGRRSGVFNNHGTVCHRDEPSALKNPLTNDADFGDQLACWKSNVHALGLVSGTEARRGVDDGIVGRRIA